MAAVRALYGRRLFQAAISVEDDLHMPWLRYFSGKVCDEFRRGGQVKGICLFEMKPDRWGTVAPMLPPSPSCDGSGAYSLSGRRAQDDA